MKDKRFKVALQVNLAVLILLIGATFFLPLSMVERSILAPLMALLAGVNWALISYAKHR